VNVHRHSSLLVCSGTKDHMSPLDQLEATRKKMKGRTELLSIDGGDHGLTVKGKGKQEAADKQMLDKIREFVHSLQSGLS